MELNLPPGHVEQSFQTQPIAEECPKCHKGILKPTNVTHQNGTAGIVMACDECPHVEDADVAIFK